MPLPLLSLLPAVSTLLDRLLPDKAAGDAAKLKLMELAQAGELANLTAETDLAKGQLGINQVEAGSSSMFVAGWRPFLGWMFGAIMFANYIAGPLLGWMEPLTHMPAPPRLDMAELWPVLMGMLGLGGLRTVEKVKGVEVGMARK